MQPEEISTLIKNQLVGAEVRVSSEDNTHYAALVIADEFAGPRVAASRPTARC
jgi:acid stress-induced BolA-like protein IbaG/YrbA